MTEKPPPSTGPISEDEARIDSPEPDAQDLAFTRWWVENTPNEVRWD